MKYNKNETCGNLLLNKNLKGKACRSYDGEVMPFLKLPPQNSCVTSKAKGPLHNIMLHTTTLGVTITPTKSEFKGDQKGPLM